MNIRKERGWPGHFIAASQCLYRRNTLVSYPDGKGVVVSTVGNYKDYRTNQTTTIGYERYYETMCFLAKEDGRYVIADVSKQVHSGLVWSICAGNAKELNPSVDIDADEMHERHVEYFMGLSSCPRTEEEEKEEEEEEEEEVNRLGLKPVWISVKDQKPKLGQKVLIKAKWIMGAKRTERTDAMSAIYSDEIDGEPGFCSLSLVSSFPFASYWYPHPEHVGSE